MMYVFADPLTNGEYHSKSLTIEERTIVEITRQRKEPEERTIINMDIKKKELKGGKKNA